MTTVQLWVRCQTGLPPWGVNLLLAGVMLAATVFVAGSVFLPQLWVALMSIAAFAAVAFGSVGLLALWKMRINSTPRTWRNWWSTTLSELYAFGIGLHLAVAFIVLYLAFLELAALISLIDGTLA